MPVLDKLNKLAFHLHLTNVCVAISLNCPQINTNYIAKARYLSYFILLERQSVKKVYLFLPLMTPLDQEIFMQS